MELIMAAIKVGFGIFLFILFLEGDFQPLHAAPVVPPYNWSPDYEFNPPPLSGCTLPLPNELQGHCNSPQASCQSIAKYFLNSFGYFTCGLSLETFAGGVQEWVCNYSHGSGPPCIWQAGIVSVCTGINQVPNPLAANGCSPPSINPKTFGPSHCSGTASDAVSYPAVGMPISVCSGNMYETAVDFRSSGINALEFIRFYNSLSSDVGKLGILWRHNFERILYIQIGTKITALRGDGQKLNFNYNSGTGTYVPADTDVPYTLTVSGSDYILTDTNDTKETYDSNGLLNSIVYRNSYTQTLDYTSNNLTEVSDNQGRSLTFTYNTDGTLATMTDPDGKVYLYVYDNPYATIPNDPYSPRRLISVTYPSDLPGHTPTITYLYEIPETPSALTGVSDELNNRYLTWGYDSATGQATSSELAGGADHTTVAYNADGTKTVTFPLGEQIKYTFTNITSANVGKLTREDRVPSTGVPAANRQYTYDSNGFLATKTDWNGNSTHYINNAQGLQTSRTEAFGTALARTITTTWHATFRLPTQIVAPRKTTDFTYDTNGNLLTRTERDTTSQSVPYSTNGQTHVWTYTYDSLGHVLTATGPRTDVTATNTYTYDSSGNLSTVTDALNYTTNITSYNNRGLPLSMTDPNGVVNNFTYDALGRILTRTVEASTGDAVTSFGYDDAGLLVSITLPDNSALAYEYDDAHRLTAVENSAGERIEYTLDDDGNSILQNIKASGGSITKTQSQVFDNIGRLLQQIGASSQTTTYGYDSQGNQLSAKNALNNTTSQAFDALNRLITVTDPLTHATGYGYDAQDNLTSVTDPRSLVTSYIYNGFGQVIQETSPDRGTTVYTLDKAGNPVNETDARGIVTNRTFDKLDRVTAETYPASSGENIAYTYDATASGNKGIGHLTGFTDESGSTALTYDERGNVVSDHRVIGTKTYTTLYAYDLADHVTQITYPSGRIVLYARDALGRINGVTTKENSGASPVTLASSITYKPFGPVASFTYGNGLTRTQTYDQDYRLTGIVTTTGANIQNLTMTYNGVDNITGITDHLDSARTQGFIYDKDYRLSRGGGAYGVVNYSYDANGNRLTRATGGVTQTYSYPGTSNKLSSINDGTTTRSLTTASNGNITADDRGAGANVTYDYSNRNRYSALTVRPDTSADYLYNALGERASKATTSGNPPVSILRHYQYDRGGHLLAIADGLTGNAQTVLIWLDEMPLAQIGSSGNIRYIHPDHLNTPQKMTDASKTIVWDRQQQPFGETYNTTGTANTVLRFPGQIADSESDLNYNMMRDYDPTLGRYIEADPIGLGGSSVANMNVYGYASQNALRYVDPWGQQVAIPAGGLLACLLSPACSGVLGTGAVVASEAIKLYMNSSPSDDAADEAQGSESQCTSPEPDDKDPCKGLKEILAEHEQKLADYIKDPHAQDHKGLLGQGYDESVINGRINNLQNQISNFKKLLAECESKNGN
jgi:RHS repeat-associated protein